MQNNTGQYTKGFLTTRYQTAIKYIYQIDGGNDMKKKVIALLISTALIGSMLTGCGQSATPEELKEADSTSEVAAEETVDATSEENTESAAITEEPVTVTILAGQSTTDAGTEEMITEKVAAAYPNVTLEWECVGWNDLAAKMQLYMQSGLPDIIIGKGQDVATYAPLGILGDLTGLEGINNVLDDATAGSTEK